MREWLKRLLVSAPAAQEPLLRPHGGLQTAATPSHHAPLAANDATARVRSGVTLASVQALVPGASVQFGVLPVPELSGQRCTVQDVRTYVFDDLALASFALRAPDGQEVFLIAAEDDGVAYLALSRRLPDDRLSSVLAATTQGAALTDMNGLTPWLSKRYRQRLMGVRGRFFARDCRSDRAGVCALESTDGRPFSYMLLIGDSDEAAIEIETYADGQKLAFCTLYRPLTDIAALHPAPARKPAVVAHTAAQPVSSAAPKVSTAPQRPAVVPTTTATPSPSSAPVQMPALMPVTQASAGKLAPKPEAAPSAPAVAAPARAPVAQKTAQAPSAPPQSSTSGSALFRRPAPAPAATTVMDAPPPTAAAPVAAKPRNAAQEATAAPAPLPPQSQPETLPKKLPETLPEPAARALPSEPLPTVTPTVTPTITPIATPTTTLLTLSARVGDTLMEEAARNRMLPEELIRKIVGLSRPVRRECVVGLHLTDDDWHVLASQYGMDPADHGALQARLTQMLYEFAGVRVDAPGGPGNHQGTAPQGGGSAPPRGPRPGLGATALHARTQSPGAPAPTELQPMEKTGERPMETAQTEARTQGAQCAAATPASAPVSAPARVAATASSSTSRQATAPTALSRAPASRTVVTPALAPKLLRTPALSASPLSSTSLSTAQPLAPAPALSRGPALVSSAPNREPSTAGAPRPLVVRSSAGSSANRPRAKAPPSPPEPAADSDTAYATDAPTGLKAAAYA